MLHREVDVPDGDILIHAGDFTMFGKDPRALQEFDAWLKELPHPNKIIVPGNHEFVLEADLRRRSLLKSATVLIDEGTAVGGLKLWGSPVTPLYGAAFGISSAAERRALYSSIPGDIDVLITHGPPYGILDRIDETQPHAGCRELFDAVLRVKPKLHVFGHIHGAAGIFHTESTTFVNTAMLGLEGHLVIAPTVLIMRRRPQAKI